MMSFDIINSENLSKISYFFFKKQLQLARMARQQLDYYSLLLHPYVVASYLLIHSFSLLFLKAGSSLGSEHLTFSMANGTMSFTEWPGKLK